MLLEAGMSCKDQECLRNLTPWGCCWTNQSAGRLHQSDTATRACTEFFKHSPRMNHLYSTLKMTAVCCCSCSWTTLQAGQGMTVIKLFTLFICCACERHDLTMPSFKYCASFILFKSIVTPLSSFFPLTNRPRPVDSQKKCKSKLELCNLI